MHKDNIDNSSKKVLSAKRSVFDYVNLLFNNEHLFLFELSSCKIIAFWGNFVDRLESFDLNRAKSCLLSAHRNVQAVLHFRIFSLNLP
jgi:hypothetical protein